MAIFKEPGLLKWSLSAGSNYKDLQAVLSASELRKVMGKKKKQHLGYFLFCSVREKKKENTHEFCSCEQDIKILSIVISLYGLVSVTVERKLRPCTASCSSCDPNLFWTVPSVLIHESNSSKWRYSWLIFQSSILTHVYFLRNNFSTHNEPTQRH